MFVAVHGAEARWRTYIGSVDSRDRIELPIESNVSYVEPGYLLFARAGSLMAQAFDLAGLQLRGEPFRVTSVVRNPEVPYRFFASRNGVLAVWLATPVPPSQLEWVDRNGTVLQSVGPAADYSSPSLSPDNTRLAVGIRPRAVGATRDLFLFDLQQGGRRQLTRDPADDMNPAWALDNETLYFTSNRNGPRRLYRMNSRTPGREEPVPVDGTAGLHEMSLESISADGLVYNHNSMGANSPGQRLELLPFAGGSPKTLIDRPGLLVKDGQVSPDGRWLAYTQTEGGLPLRHVVVSSIAVPERARVVSVKGGHSPQWNPGTQELIYLEGESRFMAVRFTTTSGEFKPEAPRFLFERALQPGVFRNQYVVDKTGQRFLINAATGTAREPHFTMFADWRALLPNP
jgi:dipeptidyl aminopeptidase/acylaminoacyl peptidase